MDCILSELKEVEDTSLIRYVAETIRKQEIRSLYESFCEPERMSCTEEAHDLDVEEEEVDDTFMRRDTIRGQKEKEKQKEKKNNNKKLLTPV